MYLKGADKTDSILLYGISLGLFWNILRIFFFIESLGGRDSQHKFAQDPLGHAVTHFRFCCLFFYFRCAVQSNLEDKTGNKKNFFHSCCIAHFRKKQNSWIVHWYSCLTLIVTQLIPQSSCSDNICRNHGRFWAWLTAEPDATVARLTAGCSCWRTGRNMFAYWGFNSNFMKHHNVWSIRAAAPETKIDHPSYYILFRPERLCVHTYTNAKSAHACIVAYIEQPSYSANWCWALCREERLYYCCSSLLHSKNHLFPSLCKTGVLLLASKR